MQSEKLMQYLQDELEACKVKYNDYCKKAIQAQTQGEKMRARNMRYYTTGKIDAIKMMTALIKEGAK